MLRIIGLSDLEYDLITTHYYSVGMETDDRSNSVKIKARFTLEYFEDHIYIDFPEKQLGLSIMRCDFWRIEIE